MDEEIGLALIVLRRELPKIPVPEMSWILHQRQLANGSGSVSLIPAYRLLRQH